MKLKYTNFKQKTRHGAIFHIYYTSCMRGQRRRDAWHEQPRQTHKARRQGMLQNGVWVWFVAERWRTGGGTLGVLKTSSSSSFSSPTPTSSYCMLMYRHIYTYIHYVYTLVRSKSTTPRVKRNDFLLTVRVTREEAASHLLFYVYTYIRTLSETFHSALGDGGKIISPRRQDANCGPAVAMR